MKQEIAHYSSLIGGLGDWVRRPRIDHQAVLAAQMENREAAFLDLARRIVFSGSQHPYSEMFRIAGCAYGDLEDSVQRRGIDETLKQLLAAGVYVTHDEFKGKKPIVRAGRELPAKSASFLNPLTRGRFVSSSGGSRSKGTVARASTEMQIYKEVYDDIEWREFGLDSRALILLRPLFPSTTALFTSIRAARMGHPAEKWFSTPGQLGDTLHYRVVTRVAMQTTRWAGARVPMPTYLPANDFSPVARWIAERKKEGKQCAVLSFVSPGVRVAAAALDENIDISGTLFMVGGEALTDAKQARIEEAGCEAFPRYWINEVGPVGLACRHMRAGNSVHVCSDSVAIIPHLRRAPLSDLDVNSLLFTNLLPHATYFLINAEMDDSGILEPTTCDCEMSRAGLNLAVRNIFSFGKLTGQGMTLYGSDLVRILEVALPQRFGGSPGDFQLVEQEGGGQTQMMLRVSPRVGAPDASDVRDFLLREIRRCFGGALAARTWSHCEAITVEIKEPLATSIGKVLPLHLLGSHTATQTAARAATHNHVA